MGGILVGQTNLRIDSLKNKGIHVMNSNNIKQWRPMGPETHQTGFKSRKSGLRPLCGLTPCIFSESQWHHNCVCQLCSKDTLYSLGLFLLTGVR